MRKRSSIRKIVEENLEVSDVTDMPAPSCLQLFLAANLRSAQPQSNHIDDFYACRVAAEFKLHHVGHLLSEVSGGNIF